MKKHTTMILALVFFVSVMLEPVAALSTGGIVEKDVRASAQTAAVDSATIIDLGTTVSGSCPAGGAVYYKFKTGSAYARYHVKLQNKGASKIEFWFDGDEVGSAYPGDTYTNEYDAFYLNPNRWHTLEVRNVGDSSVPFSLNVNDHFGNAKALTFGKKVSDNRKEWFKFKTLSNSSLYIISNTELYDKNGTNEDTNTSGTIIYCLPKNTWFTCRPYLGTMSIQDTYSISKVLKLGTKKTSQKCSAGKSVWYRFKTTSNNSHYRVTLNNGSGGKVNLEVFDAYVKAGDTRYGDDGEYDSIFISSYSKDSVLLKPTRNNWCYVKVEAPSSTANYSIIVKEEKDNGGDTFASAKKIGQSTQKGYFNGRVDTFNTIGDSDWFKFTAPVSGNYTLTLKRSKLENHPCLDVYNRDEEPIDDWEIYWGEDDSGYTKSLTLKGLKKGGTIWIDVHDHFYYNNEPGIDNGYTLSVKYKTSPTSVSSLTSKTRSIKVKWKKKTAVSGYQIKCSSSKTFSKSKTKTVTVKGKSKSSKTITKLKKGKKYYVKVRSYRVINGKRYYSKWSKVKTIKTKK